MALVGNLQDFNLQQLLHVINQGHKTGRLIIENGVKSASIYFDEGRLSFGMVDGELPILRDSLVKAGKITPELDEYVMANYRPATDKGFVLLLDEAGILSRDVVLAQETARLQHLLDLVFSWDAGTFKFEPEVLAPRENVTVSLPLEGIILEGSRQVQEQQFIDELVPDLDVVLRFASQQGDKMRTLRLSTEEWRMIASIDGKSTIRKIAEANGWDELKVRKLVYGLISSGLVDLGASTPSGETQSARADEPVPVATPKPRKGTILRLMDRIQRI